MKPSKKHSISVFNTPNSFPFPNNKRASFFSFCLLAAILFVPQASYCANLFYQADVYRSLPLTLYGTNTAFTATFPRFSPSLGILTNVSVGYTSAFKAYATSSGTGGTFVPPIYIARWDWTANFQFLMTGPGINIATNSVQNSNGGDNYGSYIQTASISVGPIYLPFVSQQLKTNSPGFSKYLGYGTVTTTNYIIESTAIYSLPAKTGGFVWFPTDKQIEAGINENAENTVSLSYGYTPQQLMITNIGLLNGQLKITVGGVSNGEIVVLQSSADLQNWFPIFTNTATGSQTIFTNTSNPNAPAVSFRAYAPQ